MTNHSLSHTDIQTILKCIENGTEIPEDLLPKLNPSFFDKLSQENKFDYQKLEKYKIPTIEYAGKRSEALILSQAGLMGGGSPLQVERCFENNEERSSNEKNLNDDWKNLIVQGDNLQFLKTCYLNQDPLIKDKVKGKIKLIYIDPPFATKGDFEGNDGEESYSDKVDRSEFLEAIRERLIFLKDILADDGSIYLHLDQKMSHYVKIIMDETFGKSNFLNEIIWMKTKPKSSTAFGKIHDTILWYAKSAERFFTDPIYISQSDEYINKTYKFEDGVGKYGWVTLDAPGQGDPKKFGETVLPPPKGRHWAWSQEKIDMEMRNGNIRIGKKGAVYQKRYLGKTEGQVVGSLWIDEHVRIGLMNSSQESYGYPTQKPERLLSRVIESATKQKDLVLDCFAGSGTTAAVAEKLGRRWIACDFGKHSIYTMQKRLLEISDSKKLGKDIKSGEKYGKSAKPFCVVSVGAYDFQRIMNLRENKPAYIDFVLSLFGITDRAEIKDGQYTDQYAHKHHIEHIYAQKDGNPVEVFPIWEDDYLKHVKIDEEYLEGIISQAGGKYRGKYYIIAPETCDVVGDTKIGDTEFIILSFPYKILEEASRNFQLTEQPSSAENINDLVSSVGFYFNEQVELGLEKTSNGLKITNFITPILNKEGNHYEGLDGLAMLLVDKDYDGKTFRIEEAVYKKDISNEGECKIASLSDSVAVIAVDKHGNESKLAKIEK